MKEWTIEEQGIYKGHKWIVKYRHPHGYRCGYVEAPDSLNKYRSKLEDLDVHGGVTFLEHFSPIDYESTLNLWVGFDCLHAGDGLTFHPKEYEGLFNGEVRSLEYCVKECERLIDQLGELEERVGKED